jgi:hypothetical protein
VKNINPQGAPKDKEQKRTPDPHVVSNVEPSPKNHPPGSERSACKPDQTPTWKVVLDCGLFVAALAVAVIYYSELSQMIQANKATRELFRSEQRPYLWITPSGGTVDDTKKTIYVIGQPSNGQFVFAPVVHIENFGQSPAVQLRVTHTKCIYGPTEDARQRAKTYTPEYIGEGTDVLIKGGPYITPVSCGDRFTQEQINEIAKGTWEVYIVGSVEYRDIFSPRAMVPYESTYCFQLLMKGLPWGNCSFGDGNFGNSIK